MLLISRDSSEFELRIIGYEFPGIERQEDDANWLRIYIRVKAPRGSWEAYDSSLQTWDVESLADWIEDLAQKRLTTSDTQEFLEPDLSFRMLHNYGQRVLLRVYFELELRPVWAYKGWVGDKDFWLDLQVTPADLLAAVHELRLESTRFPGRGEATKWGRNWLRERQEERRKLSRVTWQRIYFPSFRKL